MQMLPCALKRLLPDRLHICCRPWWSARASCRSLFTAETGVRARAVSTC